MILPPPDPVIPFHGSTMQSHESTPKGSIYQDPQYAGIYDTDRFGGRFAHQLETHEVGTLCAQLDSSCRSVLDAGSGTGKLMIPLLAAGHDVIAADSSLAMLTVARQKATSVGLAPRIIVADLQALAFSDNAFDCAVSSRVLMHLRNWQAGIAELCRVTDHAVILDFPPTLSFAGLQSLYRRIARRRADHPRQPYRTFRIRQVAHALAQQSFVVLFIKRSYFLPIILHRLIDRPTLSHRLERFCERVGLTRLLGAPATLKAVRVPGGGSTGPSSEPAR
jgi:ubiquinone/menaquinone biosynthesis C-methylase UbiE